MKKETLLTVASVGVVLLFAAEPALANTFGQADGYETLPFVKLIDQVAAAISGPIAQALGIIAMIAFGIMFSYGEGGSASRKGMGVLFGLAVAFNAATYFVNTFFGFTADTAATSFQIEAPLNPEATSTATDQQ